MSTLHLGMWLVHTAHDYGRRPTATRSRAFGTSLFPKHIFHQRPKPVHRAISDFTHQVEGVQSITLARE